MFVVVVSQDGWETGVTNHSRHLSQRFFQSSAEVTVTVMPTTTNFVAQLEAETFASVVLVTSGAPVTASADVSFSLFNCM